MQQQLGSNQAQHSNYWRHQGLDVLVANFQELNELVARSPVLPDVFDARQILAFRLFKPLENVGQLEHHVHHHD